MNYKRIIKLTNIIGLFSIVCLMYWVFITISITVFDLRVFQKKITELFFMSISGIIALMAGALIVNIMINLTRIAERGGEYVETAKMITQRRIRIALFILSFPIIGAGLGLGHFYTLKKRKDYLERSAEKIISANISTFDGFTSYQFSDEWIKNTAKSLGILSKYDSNMPSITVIVQDNINQSNNYLKFSEYYNFSNDKRKYTEYDYLLETTHVQREYLDSIFSGKVIDKLYERENSRYRLFVPYENKGKKIVIMFSDYYEYGKSGSY